MSCCQDDVVVDTVRRSFSQYGLFVIDDEN